MVERKRLKVYLLSLGNEGDFDEECVKMIMKELIKVMDGK